MPDRIFLVGLYGVRNLGDEAIRETIERGARRFGAEVTWYSTRRPQEDPRAVRLRGRGFPRYLHACLAADRVVLGGGGILKDEGIGLPLELLATAGIARLRGRPVTLLAVGVGPFYSRLGRVAVAATARLACIRTVRDAESARSLEGLGVGAVEVGADPMFSGLYAVPEAASPTQDAARPRALIAVRPWFHMDADHGRRRWPAFRDALAALVTELARRGWTVELACLYWPEDRVAAEEIADRAGDAEALTVVHGPMTWPELVRRAQASDVVVAMRYHGLAAAAVAGSPVVALPYEPKVQSLATELEVSAVPVDAPDLAGRVLTLLDGDLQCLRPRSDAVADLEGRARRTLERALDGGLAVGDAPPARHGSRARRV
jgi:polysaccharide pyruvyl transferase WcaK-like protein